MNTKRLLLLYIFLVSLPLALSWLGLISKRTLMDEVASALGMIGFTVILLEFMLSGRFRSISHRVGMDFMKHRHKTCLCFARAAKKLVG